MPQRSVALNDSHNNPMWCHHSRTTPARHEKGQWPSMTDTLMSHVADLAAQSATHYTQTLRQPLFVGAVLPAAPTKGWLQIADLYVNNVSTTLSYKEMIKIKVVDLDESYNFYVHDFFS